VDVPDQGGRTAVVTGASSGIGFETARVLAQPIAQQPQSGALPTLRAATDPAALTSTTWLPEPSMSTVRSWTMS
jgi:hypothetical protein